MDTTWKEITDIATCFRQGGDAWLELDGDSELFTTRVRVTDVSCDSISVELRKGVRLPATLPADAWGILASCGNGGVATLEVVSIVRLQSGCRLEVRLPILLRQRRGGLRLNVSLPLVASFRESRELATLKSQLESAISAPPRFDFSRAGSTIVVHNYGGYEHIDPVDVNLSADGLMLYTEAEVEPGTALSVTLFIPGFKPAAIRVVGYVLRSVLAGAPPACATDIRGAAAPSLRSGQWMTAAGFVSISKRDRESLARYLYEEQRRLSAERIVRR